MNVQRIDARAYATPAVLRHTTLPSQLWEASLESDVLGVLAVISFEWRDTAVYCHAVATSPAYRSRAGSSGSLQAGSRLVAFVRPRPDSATPFWACEVPFALSSWL